MVSAIKMDRHKSPPQRRQSIVDTELLAEPELQEQVFDGLLARRGGSVLTRNTILKSDHFGNMPYSGIDLNLLGAPNFRQAHLNVFGVAQPTIAGLSTVLRMLRCGPSNEICTPEHSCTWFSTREEPLIYINGRPFVLRDRQSPFENIRSYAGIAATRLEQMELRLKSDILDEAAKHNGLLLVHDEVKDHQIVPCLTAIDSVMTSAEVFNQMQDLGFCVDYKRVPVSNEQSPTDAFIDEYVRIFRTMPLEKHSVIFSSGIGIGRTTYTMAIGMILRRIRILRETSVDTIQVKQPMGDDLTTRVVLRLISVLEQGLQDKNVNRSAIEWTLARSNLIDELKAAIQGNYLLIQELVRVLDQGPFYKKLVDETIDHCEAVLNIREQILINRVKQSVNEGSNALDLGIGYMERYFSLIAFCAFIDETYEEGGTFADWIKDHRDIWNMLHNIRRTSDKIMIFRPVDDLSVLAMPSPTGRRMSIIEEIPEHNVIKARGGSVLSDYTILKIDHWKPEGQLRSILTGAPNFRQVYTNDMQSRVYASAQPTLSALKSIIGMIHEQLKAGESICWINVREEPLIYIDNEPYVLRDRYATLRNIKSYSGIKAERLELMEGRLKEDILNEASRYNNRILVHCETGGENETAATVFPSWVSVSEDSDVMTLAEIFQDLQQSFSSLVYTRIPVTAEEPMEPEDFDVIMQTLLTMSPGKCHVIFNCQMGASRSTTGAVIAGLINNWRLSIKERDDKTSSLVATSPRTLNRTHHYRIIHSILRVIKNGLECKELVDTLIDEAAAMVNLRDSIERYRQQAEMSSDPTESRRALLKGIAALKRYSLLILFQGYLQSFSSDEDIAELESFTGWLNRHQEFQTLLHELDRKGVSVELLHIEENQTPMGGPALAVEVLDVVKNRKGQVLAAMTILKFDHFPGCQKMSLPERIDGGPNFREVMLNGSSSVIGLAMPTKTGFIRALDRIKTSVLWVCLREEPVLYIKGRPFVLRIVKDPVVNLEMTGIISERVELMEDRMKQDALREVEQFEGRLLLHEEDATTGAMIPIWELVKPEEIETTSEIMDNLKSAGFPIDYARIPITDEQAPIPSVFDELLELITSHSDSFKACVFNCQMGRGRTTTGMVIAVLSQLVQSGVTPSVAQLEEENEEDESKRYLAGEYRLILQCLQLIEHGKRAKYLVDMAIDKCAHIQNLRTAVYDFKLRGFDERGVNYLLRYFFLIVFCEYLLQEHSPDNMQKKEQTITFFSWLGERREISNLVNSCRSQTDFY